MSRTIKNGRVVTDPLWHADCLVLEQTKLDLLATNVILISFTKQVDARGLFLQQESS
jgi:hypothetical protein